MKRRCYHTPSTIPDCVRPEVVQGWNRMWNWMRRKPKSERSRWFVNGAPIKVGGVLFVLRRGEERVTNIQRRTYWALMLGGDEVRVTISCAFGDSKPYTYMDELQAAMDELLVRSVIEA